MNIFSKGLAGLAGEDKPSFTFDLLGSNTISMVENAILQCKEKFPLTKKILLIVSPMTTENNLSQIPLLLRNLGYPTLYILNCSKTAAHASGLTSAITVGVSRVFSKNMYTVHAVSPFTNSCLLPVINADLVTAVIKVFKELDNVNFNEEKLQRSGISRELEINNIRKSIILYGNGANAEMSQAISGLMREISKDLNVTVIHPPEAEYSHWIGGSIQTNSSMFDNQWASLYDTDEFYH